MLKIAFNSNYVLPLPEGHRFPMVKYELLPQQLLREGIVTEENFFKPHKAEESTILRTHSETYWNKLKSLSLTRKEERRTGFPLTRELIEREITILQGTIKASVFALEYGVAFNIAGGTHHAYTDRGEGFCILNDNACAANYLLDNGLAKQVLVVDLDVHQGNGTAEIFQNEPRVFTFSMHGKDNYPMHKEQSDLDIEIPTGTTDEAYLEVLESNLVSLIESVKPDFIFYQAGVDVLETDKLGKLSLSIEGCAQRDRLVFETCKKHTIPVCVTMGGGYSPQIKHILDAHVNTYKIASEVILD